MCIIRILVTIGIVVSFSTQATAQTTAPTRAAVDERVWVILNNIKYDKKEQFDDVLSNEVMTALHEYRNPDDEKHALNLQATKGLRVLRPAVMNEDSTWTFIFIFDPYIEGANYTIGRPLRQKYGEDGAEEVFGRWSECFNSGQALYMVNQTDL